MKHEQMEIVANDDSSDGDSSRRPAVCVWRQRISDGIGLISQSFDSVRELVRSWYAVDRIRIAPATGRLLKLRTGDSFILFGDLYSITQREACTTSNGHNVTYTVEQSQKTGTLQIFRDQFSHAATCARLAIDGGDLEVFDDDVAIVERDYGKLK